MSQKKTGDRLGSRVPKALVALAFLALMVSPQIWGVDISKRVELQFYMLGEAPKDLAKIQSEINKMAEKDLNATVKFNFISFVGYQQKYNLLLTSGQPIDLLFTADWLTYNEFAKRGAFLDIEAVIKTAAPDLYSFVPQETWNGVKVGGKVYTMPATWREYVNEGIIYREDLRKKYSLPRPDSLQNLETYLTGIKKNNLDIQPTFQLKDTPAPQAALALKYPWIESPVSSLISYGLRYNYKVPDKLFNYLTSKDFVDDAKMFKRWADLGFWSKSALSVDSPPDGLESGLIASRLDGQNAVKYAQLVYNASKIHPEFEFGYIPYAEANKLVHPVHPTHNGFAVPRSSRNAERAVMFFAKLVLDKRYNLLTQFGIEGTHYTIGSKGEYEAIGDPTTSAFPFEAMNGWAWRNPSFHLYPSSYDLIFKMFKEYDKEATPNIRDGFAEDRKPFQSEQAAFNQVFNQYGLPIFWGLAGEPTIAVKKFLEKAKTAGLDKIQTEITKQWASYLKANNIQ